MRTLLCFIGLILLSTSAYTQTKHVTVKGQGVLESMSLTADRNPKKQIKGSPYLNRDYMYGTITLVNEKIVKGLLRYNVRSQDFEVVLQQDTLYLAEPEMIKKAEFAGKTFVYSLAVEKINGRPYLSGGYFEVVAGEGESAQLLIRYGKEIKESSYASTYMGGGGTGFKRYVSKQSYYIKPGEGREAVRVHTPEDLLAPFRDHRKEVEQIRSYISRNNINANNVEDLKKFLNYCNQLVG